MRVLRLSRKAHADLLAAQGGPVAFHRLWVYEMLALPLEILPEEEGVPE